MAKLIIETEDMQFFNMSALDNKELVYLQDIFNNEHLNEILRKLFNAQVLSAATELITNAERDYGKNDNKAIKVNAMASVTSYVLDLGKEAKQEIDKREKEEKGDYEEYPSSGI